MSSTTITSRVEQNDEGAILPAVVEIDGDQNTTEERNDGAIFSEYVSVSLNSLLLRFDRHNYVNLEAKPHPGSIAESSLLANTPVPSIDYPVGVFLKAIQAGAISSLQLEGLLSASQAHQYILPDGKRAGNAMMCCLFGCIYSVYYADNTFRFPSW